MDRKAYLKSYYEKNKEKLKEKRMEKVHINSLFKQLKVENSTYRKLSSTEISLLVLFVFLVGNTYFLVYEQISFYRLKSYSLSEAIFFSVLTEMAILLLSFYSSYVPEKSLQFFLKILLAGSVICVGLLIDAGVKKKSSVEAINSTKFQHLTDELNTLKGLEEKALENISSWDAKIYKSKREILLRELNEGIRRSKEEKLKQLTELSIPSDLKHETDILQWLRYLSIGWNIALSSLFSYLLRSHKKN